MERVKFNELPNGLVEKMMAIESYLKTTSLDHKLLELMRLRVSQINKCAYCVDMHYKELKHAGETELRISTLCVWRETSFFTEKEMAILRFAEALTEISHADISDNMFQELNSFYSTQEVCDLTFAVTQINSWNRLVGTFKFEAGKYEVTD